MFVWFESWGNLPILGQPQPSPAHYLLKLASGFDQTKHTLIGAPAPPPWQNQDDWKVIRPRSPAASRPLTALVLLPLPARYSLSLSDVFRTKFPCYEVNGFIIYSYISGYLQKLNYYRVFFFFEVLISLFDKLENKQDGCVCWFDMRCKDAISVMSIWENDNPISSLCFKPGLLFFFLFVS